MTDDTNGTEAEAIREIERLTQKDVPIEVDPEAADAMGAFDEQALDDDAALESLDAGEEATDGA